MLIKKFILKVEMIGCFFSYFFTLIWLVYFRHRHATAAVGSNIYVFGGINNEIVHSCMNVLKTETLDWSNANILGELPCARHSHSMVAYGTLLFMFGGYDGQKALGDLYSFDTRTSIWKREKTTGRAPSPRFSHSMFIYKHLVGIIGGCPLTQHNEELALLNLINNMWINVSLDTIGRDIWIRSTTSVIGDELIIIGGGSSCYAFGTKFSYPKKMSLNSLSIEDTFSIGVNEESVTSYVVEGQNIFKLNGDKLQDRFPVSRSYLEADLFATKRGIQSDAKHFALQIEKKHAKLVKDVLKKFGWLDLTKKVYHNLDGLHICLPISGEFYDFYKKESLNFKDKATGLCEEIALLEEFSIHKVTMPMALHIFSLFHASVIIDDVPHDKKILSTPQKVMREMVSSLLTEKQLPLGMLEELPVRSASRL